MSYAEILLQCRAKSNEVALFLEEAGLAYEAIPIDARRGDQFAAAYLAINPNAKVPSIVDGDIPVFDSNAILLYLAEKTGKFLPENTPAQRAQLLSWLMFVASGVGPYSGQALHFKNHAPRESAYARNRYDFESNRHYGILDAWLGERPYVLGDTYTIVDIAAWGWARLVPSVLGEEAFAKMPNLKRLVDEISARPAATRRLQSKTSTVSRPKWTMKRGASSSLKMKGSRANLTLPHMANLLLGVVLPFI